MCVTIAPPTLPQTFTAAAATEEYSNHQRSSLESHHSGGGGNGHSAAPGEMRLIDYFFLDPLFIIGVLVLFVIIVIIISWWIDKRKLEKEEAGGGEGKDKHKDAEMGGGSELNPEVLASLLTEEKEAKNRYKNKFRGGRNRSIKEQLLVAVVDDGTVGVGGNMMVGGGGGGGGQIICDENGECEIDDEDEGDCDVKKIPVLFPQKNFRDFPKTDEEQMAMRRENFLTVLTLPPL